MRCELQQFMSLNVVSLLYRMYSNIMIRLFRKIPGTQTLEMSELEAGIYKKKSALMVNICLPEE